VAWALSTRPDDIKIVTKWQSSRSFVADDAKTPTQIVYANRRTRELAGWGYEIEARQEPLRWFKLCLEQKKYLNADVQRSEQLETAQRLLSNQGITAVDAAADFLRQLWGATIESIEKQYGDAVKGLPFRVILTVPAMWSDGAKDNTLKAARQAGIQAPRLCGDTTLDLVPEPEAAALAVLADFGDRPGVQAGDVITVCDCGGGTVVCFNL